MDLLQGMLLLCLAHTQFSALQCCQPYKACCIKHKLEGLQSPSLFHNVFEKLPHPKLDAFRILTQQCACQAQFSSNCQMSQVNSLGYSTF